MSDPLVHLRLLSFDAPCVVPRLSTVAIANAGEPENDALKKLMLDPPARPTALAGRRVALLATDGVEELELTISHRYFLERGAKVEVVSPRFAPPPPKFGVQYPEMRRTHLLTVRFLENAGWFKIDRFVDAVKVDDYDAILVPGGAWNPLGLRANPMVVAFVKAFHASGRLTAGICHGPMVFIECGFLRNRRATCFWDIMTDLRNAGAEVLDVPLVTDGNLVTSRFIYDLPVFLAEISARLAKTSVTA